MSKLMQLDPNARITNIGLSSFQMVLAFLRHLQRWSMLVYIMIYCYWRNTWILLTSVSGWMKNVLHYQTAFNISFKIHVQVQTFLCLQNLKALTSNPSSCFSSHHQRMANHLHLPPPMRSQQTVHQHLTHHHLCS